jgi:hypothetical protein
MGYGDLTSLSSENRATRSTPLPKNLSGLTMTVAAAPTTRKIPSCVRLMSLPLCTGGSGEVDPKRCKTRIVANESLTHRAESVRHDQEDGGSSAILARLEGG